MGRVRYPSTVCLAVATAHVGKGGCYFCRGVGIAPHPRCPAGNNLTGVEPKHRDTTPEARHDA